MEVSGSNRIRTEDICFVIRKDAKKLARVQACPPSPPPFLGFPLYRRLALVPKPKAFIHALRYLVFNLRFPLTVRYLAPPYQNAPNTH